MKPLWATYIPNGMAKLGAVMNLHATNTGYVKSC